MSNTSGAARSIHHTTFSSRAFSELTFHVAILMRRGCRNAVAASMDAFTRWSTRSVRAFDRRDEKSHRRLVTRKTALVLGKAGLVGSGRRRRERARTRW